MTKIDWLIVLAAVNIELSMARIVIAEAREFYRHRRSK